MTEMKAIKYLKHMMQCMADEPPENLTNERDVKEWKDEHEKITNSIEIAIKALEKQVPKKLRENDECIGCGNELWMLRDTGAKYCQYCGQAIDWSDEE